MLGGWWGYKTPRGWAVVVCECKTQCKDHPKQVSNQNAIGDAIQRQLEHTDSDQRSHCDEPSI